VHGYFESLADSGISGVNASSKLGGRREWGVGRDVPLERGQFLCFVISKWHILVNSQVRNLRFFFIVSSIGGVRVDSVANFGFQNKTMNKRYH